MPFGTPIHISGFGISHVGRVRQRNEDCFYIDPAGRFAILADGMGGHLGGQEASTMTVEIVRQCLEMQTPKHLHKNSNRFEFIRQAFIRAATQVASRGKAVPTLFNMGTTLVVWARFNSDIFIGYSGDSRAYLLRNEKLYLMTQDHNLSNEQIKNGVSREIALSLPMGHVLVRNVGMMPASEPTIFQIPLRSMDVWLLCSDGLSNKLSSSDICAAIQKEKHSLALACQGLVEEAYMRGGEDNISVVLLKASAG